MKRRIAWYVLIVGLIGIIAVLGFRKTSGRAVSAEPGKPVIILDPGHGGIDGGAVSKSGIVEKDINLSVALKLRELLRLSGYTVIMTRETDCSIHDPSARTVREIKSSDIRNRLALMKQHGGVFVSIHQNSFPESKYSGAQFFYASAPGSKELAESFRSTVCAQLQPENRRETKPCTDDVYLIYHAVTTAVLAECGFLSNPGEAAKLSSESYQQEMAFALYCGLIQFFQKNGG
jgi:N-acetylmuramoyl-L-alanine amidase